MNAMKFCIPRVLSRLARDRRGSSAVEFAIIAPLMLGLYIGCVEISDGVAADRKVTLTAGALANLASQVQTIDATGMTNIMNAATAIISPYSAGNLTTTVTCIKIDATKNATVAWSKTVGGTAHSVGSAITVPSEITIASSSLVLSRGDLFVQARHRLHSCVEPHRGNRHYVVGQDVHEPAHHCASLRRRLRRQKLHALSARRFNARRRLAMPSSI